MSGEKTIFTQNPPHTNNFTGTGKHKYTHNLRIKRRIMCSEKHVLILGQNLWVINIAAQIYLQRIACYDWCLNMRSIQSYFIFLFYARNRLIFPIRFGCDFCADFFLFSSFIWWPIAFIVRFFSVWTRFFFEIFGLFTTHNVIISSVMLRFV